MEVGLVLGLLKVIIETFKDERQGHFSKQYNSLQGDYDAEMDKGLEHRSDLAISRIVRECSDLTKLVVAELSKK
jgi:hypothetical protein